VGKAYKVCYAFYFKDSSQAECSQVIAGIGPSPGLLQSAMTCHPEHTVGIPDRNTSQPCNMLKVRKFIF
jgi:hypothetical protein